MAGKAFFVRSEGADRARKALFAVVRRLEVQRRELGTLSSALRSLTGGLWLFRGTIPTAAGRRNGWLLPKISSPGSPDFRWHSRKPIAGPTTGEGPSDQVVPQVPTVSAVANRLPDGRNLGAFVRNLGRAASYIGRAARIIVKSLGSLASAWRSDREPAERSDPSERFRLIARPLLIASGGSLPKGQPAKGIGRTVRWLTENLEREIGSRRRIGVTGQLTASPSARLSEIWDFHLRRLLVEIWEGGRFSSFVERLIKGIRGELVRQVADHLIRATATIASRISEKISDALTRVVTRRPLSVPVGLGELALVGGLRPVEEAAEGVGKFLGHIGREVLKPFGIRLGRKKRRVAPPVLTEPIPLGWSIWGSPFQVTTAISLNLDSRQVGSVLVRQVV